MAMDQSGIDRMADKAFGAGRTSHGAVKKPARKPKVAAKGKRMAKAPAGPTTLGGGLGQAAATVELREGQGPAPGGEKEGVDGPNKSDHDGEGDGGERRNAGGIAGEQLRSYIERIERLEEEKKGIGADIRDVYAEAKHSGFDPKIMRECIRRRRMSLSDRQEHDALLETYQFALGI